MSSLSTPRSSTRHVLRQVPLALRWVWEADTKGSLLLLLVTLVMALLPAGMAWVGRRIIDSVVLAAQTHSDVDRDAAMQVMALELALSLVLLGSRRAQAYLREMIRTRVSNLLNDRLLVKALSLELVQFERSSTYDLLQNAHRDAANRPYSLAAATLMLARSVITLVSLGALLWQLAWWSVLLLALSAIPEFFFETKVSAEAYRLATARAQDNRKLTYLESIVTKDAHVKEVKLYDLGELVMTRYRALFSRFFREDQRLGRKHMALGTLFAGLSSVSFYVCYASVGYRAAMGLLGVGDLTLAIAAFRQGQGALEDVLGSLSGMFDDARYVANVSAFLELPPPEEVVRARSGHRHLPPGRFSIEVEHLSFRYPGREAWAVRDVSFTLAPGEKLALVGENGAGKSTLIKLLLRLYEPTEGTIRYGGIDVRELDTVALRTRLGAVFQDFVRYQMTAAENIGLGDVARLAEPSVIEQAAADGGALEVIESLPNRHDTVLGTWFEDGRDLSGGQWQKLAIARSFMRLSSHQGTGADLLILDEPTAAIDAEAEVALFERFKKLTVGRTAIIISHRFSTVRIADRIAVLEQGRVIELDSHERLLELNGRYAHLFRLQARGYQ